jgi:hypothetical protein
LKLGRFSYISASTCDVSIAPLSLVHIAEGLPLQKTSAPPCWHHWKITRKTYDKPHFSTNGRSELHVDGYRFRDTQTLMKTALSSVPSLQIFFSVLCKTLKNPSAVQRNIVTAGSSSQNGRVASELNFNMQTSAISI